MILASRMSCTIRAEGPLSLLSLVYPCFGDSPIGVFSACSPERFATLIGSRVQGLSLVELRTNDAPSENATEGSSSSDPLPPILPPIQAHPYESPNLFFIHRPRPNPFGTTTRSLYTAQLCYCRDQQAKNHQRITVGQHKRRVVCASKQREEQSK